MIYINKAIIMGRLGADPETRTGGVVVCRVATSERWKDKQGEPQERTQWHSVVIFAEQPGRFLAEYGRKGDLVCIEGQIETRKWERGGDQEDKFYTEVVVRPFNGSVQLMSKQGRDEAQEPEERRQAAKPQENRSTAQGPTNRRSNRLDDDEIPF